MKKRSSPKFAIIDAETDPFIFGRIPKPFLWGYFDGIEFKTFLTTEEMINFISLKKITIYAHNGGKFDYMFLLDHINPFEKPTIINNRLSKIRIGKCTLVDSYNILPIALGKYKKDSIDYAKFEKRVRHKYMSEIIDYLRSDCIYLHELVKRYRDEYGADLTQASGAIKTFQKMQGEKVPRHKDAAIFSNFKKYYHGGRVECFKTGIIEKKFNVYDINSAYPFAMMYNHPYGLDFIYGEREIPFSDTERVFYRLECVSRGAFPYREKKNSGLTFPNDKQVREFYITDWEYWTAKNAKLITHIKIIECVIFPTTRNFSEYVTKFYNGRKQAKLDNDHALDMLYKFRLNSLYGKFGSDYRKYENYIVMPKDFESDDWEKIDEFGKNNNLLSCPLADDEMNFYNVATAASITGFVRAYLLAAMVNVGPDNVLYCDTDSITTLSGDGLNVGRHLGAWKDEGKFVKAGIAGKKLYIFKAVSGKCKTASKGVKLTNAQLWRVCGGDTVTHKKPSPSFSITGKARFTKRKIKITA